MDRFAEWVWQRLGAFALSAVPVATFMLAAIGVDILRYSVEQGDAMGAMFGAFYVCIFTVASVAGVALAWREWRKP